MMNTLSEKTIETLQELHGEKWTSMIEDYDYNTVSDDKVLEIKSRSPDGFICGPTWIPLLESFSSCNIFAPTCCQWE